jgi:acetylornithine deacetylase/succinyl-diaminopimelate desuccinylase-like protein
MAHVGALRAWGGRPPVGVKVVIEGMEEVGGGALTTYPPQNPEMFHADVMIIGDMGNVRPGVPTLTVALRGMANVMVEVRTLASAKHSGLYGGAAPDALLALIRALATLHDERGDVAVDGLRREEWTGASNTEEELRALAEVEDGQPLIGTGDVGSRVWSGPAITVIGIDVPSVADSVNAVSPYARAKLNLRVHPEQDAGEAQAALMRHLQQQMPFGIRLEVHPGATGNGYAARTSSVAYEAARRAWSAAWGAETVTIGAGGSRWSARSKRRFPAPTCCWWAPPTGTRTSTGRTSGCSWMSSRRPRWPRLTCSGGWQWPTAPDAADDQRRRPGSEGQGQEGVRGVSARTRLH